MKVWLDDWRTAPEEYTHSVKTVLQTVALLETGLVEEISLDYDINWDAETGDEDWENRQTGMGVVLWMEKHQTWPKIIRIHSSAAEGALRMRIRLGEHYTG